MMKLNQIPLMYNVDKVRVYKSGRKVVDTWVSSHKGIEACIRENAPDGLMNCTIESMAVVVEDNLGMRVILEIYIKNPLTNHS